MLKPLTYLIVAGLSFTVYSIEVKSPFNSSLTPIDLVESIIGSGFEISNIEINGDQYSMGTYTGADVEVHENTFLSQGLAFSSGNVSMLNFGTNLLDNMNTSAGNPGDPDLDILLQEKYGIDNKDKIETYDAVSMEFDFSLENNTPVNVFMGYVFGSDEYEEYVGSYHDDLFGIFLDDENIATVPGTDDYISVNNINQTVNSQFYTNNILVDNIPGNSPLATEMDGFTIPMNTSFTIANTDKHHLKVVIANVGDPAQDAWLLIRGKNEPSPIKNVPEPSVFCLMAFSFLIVAVSKFVQSKKSN
jgi:hypothetical protein